MCVCVWGAQVKQHDTVGLYQRALTLPCVLTCLRFYLSPVALPTCPSSFKFPSSSFSFVFFYYEEALSLFRGRLGVPQRVPSKPPFPPRHKVSCILKHSIVSTATTASCSLEEPYERSLSVCLLYVCISLCGCFSAYMCKGIC